MLETFVIDKNSILARLGGDEDIYTMMVDMFLQDVGNNCTALGEALASGEIDAIRREVHTVKGLLATFSDDVGAGEALRIEQLIKQGEMSSLAADVGGLQARLQEVAGALRAGQA